MTYKVERKINKNVGPRQQFRVIDILAIERLLSTIVLITLPTN